MKVLTSKENEIMNILWAEETPLSAQDICQRCNNFSIYSVQQLLQKLLKSNYIYIVKISHINKSLARLFKAKISQEEYIAFLLGSNKNNIYKTTSYLISNKSDKETLNKLQKLIDKRIKEIGE